MNGNELVGGVKHLKKTGLLWLVIFGVVAGVILLIIGSKADGDENIGVSDGFEESALSLAEYETQKKEEIRLACQSIMANGQVESVTIYFERGYEAIYARDEQGYESGSGRKEYVIIGSGTNAHALYLGREQPKISGIGVVCSGESEHEVSQMVNLLAGIYGISHNRIYIV